MSGPRLLAPESQSQSDNTQTSQQQQPRGLRNGQHQQGLLEWTVHIEENDYPERRSPFVVSIFRVPKTLMKESKEGEAYVPTRVSFGPYHHAELPLMENYKGKALHRMIRRRMNGSDPNNMDFSARAMKEILELEGEMLLLETEIKENYEEKIKYDEQIFAAMLILDGCFIIEILRALGRDHSPGENEYYEPLFQSRKIKYTKIDILNDILKLENQIPLIVLRKLLQWEVKSDDVEKMLCDLLYKPFLGFFYPFDCKKNICSSPDVKDVPHLLGLLHACILSPGEEDNSVNENEGAHSDCSLYWIFQKILEICIWIFTLCIWIFTKKVNPDVERIPHAVQLRKSGIKFKKFEESAEDGINGILFDKKSATIFLPTIIITDSTEIVFRNVIAFEMCMQLKINPVAFYLILMGMLIGSEEDVALLTRKRIITNWLGSDKEVAKLFHGLCKGMAANTNDQTRQLVKEVNLYYKKKWTFWFAEFKHTYFSSPWNVAGLCAATTLLLLTIVQTVFVILTYDVTLSSRSFIAKYVREPLFQIFH